MNEIGSIASIVSLLITIWMAQEIGALRKYYKRHLVLPKLLGNLQRNLRNAQSALNAKRIEEAKDSFNSCDAIAERIVPHVDATANERISTARASIKKASENGEQHFIANGFEAIRCLNAAIESTNAFTGDDKWKT